MNPSCGRGGGGGLSVVLYLVVSCLLYSLTESDTAASSSYTWRLDLAGGEGKIVADMGSTSTAGPGDDNQELMMDILLSTVTDNEGMWKKTSSENYCRLYGMSQCQRHNPARNNRGLLIDPDSSGDIYDEDEVLDCGKPVNFTYYDHLVGIQNRASHLHIPEPEVAALFRSSSSSGSATKKSKKSGSGGSSSGGGSDIDIDAIERRLKRAKREKPKSVEIYNQIANYWRIKGDTQASIECFRRALSVSPNNAEILLNLARVLFNLQYLDDAIFLTRRSLEVQPPDQNAWQQHFQLGEILKAYGHFQEAALHLRHVLELRPNHQPAAAILKEMEASPDSTVHVYTILIIVCLVLAVLGWILSTLDASLAEEAEASSQHRVKSISRHALKHRK